VLEFRPLSPTNWLCVQVPGNKAAIEQHYNAASDRYISHDGVVHALAKAAGVEANIVHYDTKAVSLAKVQPFTCHPSLVFVWLYALLQQACPDVTLTLY